VCTFATKHGLIVNMTALSHPAVGSRWQMAYACFHSPHCNSPHTVTVLQTPKLIRLPNTACTASLVLHQSIKRSLQKLPGTRAMHG
jgi:hypothetical protein